MLIPWHMSFLSYFFIFRSTFAYTTLFLFLEGFLLIFLWCKSGSNGLFFFSIKFTFLDLYYSSIFLIEMHFCFVYTVLWGFFFSLLLYFVHDNELSGIFSQERCLIIIFLCVYALSLNIFIFCSTLHQKNYILVYFYS